MKSCSQQDGEDLEVFMSGASNGEAVIVNWMTSLPQERDHMFLGWFLNLYW